MKTFLGGKIKFVLSLLFIIISSDQLKKVTQTYLLWKLL